MTALDDDLRTALHAQAHALRVPERPALEREISPLRRRPELPWLMTAACLALVVAGLVALAQRRTGDPAPAPPVATLVPNTTTPAPIPTDASIVLDTTSAPPVVSVVPSTTPPTPVMNGWVALDSGPLGASDISLVRPGEDTRRLEVAGWETADEACPAWSPDGTRLLFGRLSRSPDTFGAAELLIVPVGADGAAGTPTVIALDGFAIGGGFEPHPCAIWAPDGRWAAFAGGGEVWVVDTQSSAIRRVPDLRPSDLEWRPGTDELAIAGDIGTDRAAPTLSSPVTVYSVSTGDLRQLGAVEAAHLTWSPDGSTLAYAGGEDDPDELSVVDADGADKRVLTRLGEAIHGIGPVWSPAGDRIAYQRRCCGGQEPHEVVLVSVVDGTETVIEPPESHGPNGPARWFPFFVTWSPDGTTLVYAAWTDAGVAGVISVPADTPSDVTVLTDEIPTVVGDYSHRWAPTQMWGRQPG